MKDTFIIGMQLELKVYYNYLTSPAFQYQVANGLNLGMATNKT